MTKTATLAKSETLDSQQEAELTELFRDIDRRLKNIRKRQTASARLRESTRASLERMKSW
jgi:hypothetical protein